jgi:ribulose 1,5-bisphosphate synthetase/thiazole synthase
MEMDVAIVGAGLRLTQVIIWQKRIKTVYFERKLSIGGGMWGAG